jgi:predicted DNA-binding protein (MmcQ/YjbR family)
VPEEPPSTRFPPVGLPYTTKARGLQAYCLSFYGAWEDYPWGEVVYKVGAKIFAFVGTDAEHVTLKATPDDAAVLVERPHIERAAYIGRHGWITLALESEDDLELARDLIAASYALVSAGSGARQRKRRTGRKMDRPAS